MHQESSLVGIGCLANYHHPYKSEIEFASVNHFDLVQIWYDSNGIAMSMDEDPISSIREAGFPSIIHAVLDLNEFDEHVPRLERIVGALGHRELIIHPICKSEPYTDASIHTLSLNVQSATRLFSASGIDLYIENNSALDPLLNTPEEVRQLFRSNPDVKFILDVAHIRDYDHLRAMVNEKFPEMLHVADKHFSVTHEHLPLGEGELDFDFIFNEVLKDFSGKIILEVVQSKDDILRSRDRLLKTLGPKKTEGAI